jgi:hypothetical protein
MQFNNIEHENCVVMLNIDAHKIFNITCLLILLMVSHDVSDDNKFRMMMDDMNFVATNINYEAPSKIMF